LAGHRIGRVRSDRDMTNTRSLITRFALPLAATALVLTACGSSTTDEAAAPAAETAMASEEAMASDEMASDEMASDEMASDDAMSDDAMSDDAASEEMASSGGYITLADYQAGKDMYDSAGNVVLFFNATWCPTCQETVKNLEADPDAIPAGLTVVSVDFDTADDLKKQYGITTQHTFVQVDADGNELAKWTGSSTAEDIAGQTT
jgi:pentapeptide MXKDX repeat protein